MTISDGQEPEGTTLNVYSFVVKKGKPVGPREVMRDVNLSSPSVAYWIFKNLKIQGCCRKTKLANILSKKKQALVATYGLAET